jgi:hypothetical protein
LVASESSVVIGRDTAYPAFVLPVKHASDGC